MQVVRQIVLQTLHRGQIDIDPLKPGKLGVMIPEEPADFVQDLVSENADFPLPLGQRDKRGGRKESALTVREPRKRLGADGFAGFRADNGLQTDHRGIVRQGCQKMLPDDLNPVAFLHHLAQLPWMILIQQMGIAEGRHQRLINLVSGILRQRGVGQHEGGFQMHLLVPNLPGLMKAIDQIGSERFIRLRIGLDGRKAPGAQIEGQPPGGRSPD